MLDTITSRATTPEIHPAMSSAYYTLMGSLPALPSNFVDAERVPISRSTLDERLKMLTDHDGVVIQAMTDFLVWERQPIEHSDEEVVRHYEQFMQTIRDAFAKSLIREVMVVRTIRPRAFPPWQNRWHSTGVIQTFDSVHTFPGSPRSTNCSEEMHRLTSNKHATKYSGAASRVCLINITFPLRPLCCI